MTPVAGGSKLNPNAAVHTPSTAALEATGGLNTSTSLPNGGMNTNGANLSGGSANLSGGGSLFPVGGAPMGYDMGMSPDMGMYMG